MAARSTARLASLVGLAALITVRAIAQQSSVAPNQSSGPLLAPASDTATIRGTYLDLLPSASEETIVAGRPLTLKLDVIPKKNVHVYGPGNPGYTAVTWTMDPQPGVAAGAVKYPRPVEFFFAPLGERVKVYSEPFQLSRVVTVKPTSGAPLTLNPSAAPTLSITGRVEYQACDDKVCYLPQTVPLTWTMALKR